MSSLSHDLYPREIRMLRAIQDVLKKYSIHETTRSGARRRTFRVTGGTRPYDVTVREDWSESPACTCPDFLNRASRQNRGYCKHIIAVLFLYEELKCQLLELFL